MQILETLDIKSEGSENNITSNIQILINDKIGEKDLSLQDESISLFSPSTETEVKDHETSNTTVIEKRMNPSVRNP